MLSEVDADGNGDIDFDEYMQLMGFNIQSVETVEHLIEAFRPFDEYGDGFIPAHQLRHALKHAGEKLTDNELDELISEADVK